MVRKEGPKVRSLAIVCSGGDGPGMNCAIRAIVRRSIGKGIKAYGVLGGYGGLLNPSEAIVPMGASSVGNIIHHGGTILKSGRCQEFHRREGRQEAAQALKERGIEALIVIGGNGSYQGAWHFFEEHKIPLATIPGTIDNDIGHTDLTVGFDTAVGNAVSAVDKIRDTANSHMRTFLVEVMGRGSPAIALHVGLCTGAENVVLPSGDIPYEEMASNIQRGIQRGKASSIIIVAEREERGAAYKIQQALLAKFQLSSHVCVLGHIQRGGIPSPTDRFLASQMGCLAVDCLANQGPVRPLAMSFQKGALEAIGLDQCLKGQGERDFSGPLATIKALSI